MENAERQTLLKENESIYHKKVATIQLAYHDMIMEMEVWNDKSIEEKTARNPDADHSSIVDQFNADLAKDIQELRNEQHQLIAKAMEDRDHLKAAILHA